ncbi:MAG TPA: helix-turn-helix transcriptional regulator [Miltoncostaeaceae bacterium]|nr:helix-turn-helix transcriptional regulator [Miltoncostaeaceae bacterium]
MARVAHDELSADPGLARALRWLRHRRRMTQGRLREAVEAAGGRISVIHIQQLEAGRRRPSPEMLDRLLAALASDRDELGAVLAETAAAPAPERSSGWRPRRRDSDGGATWSDAVEPAGPSASSTERVLAAVPDHDPELRELLRIYRRLRAGDRRALLARARELADRPRGASVATGAPGGPRRDTG